MKQEKNKVFPAKSSTRSYFSLGFTLVELIVVVTILAILATIGFVSYSSYLTGVRDTNRLAQLVSISDGLELYRTKNDLPLPDDNVEVSINGSLIAYQGTAGSNTLETIDFTKGGVDPKDSTYFSYYLTKDRKYYQLLGFLEEESNITSFDIGSNIFPQTQAMNYDNRIPTVYGKKLGILTDTNNTPIEQAGLDIDITSATTGYIAHMTDTDTLSGSSLQSINPKASCKRIKQMSGGSSDGVYEINPTGAEDAEFDVYCDMTTDGGGWTALLKINPSIKNSNEWYSDVGTSDGDYYNYLDKSGLFEQNEIYSNKRVGFDGSEYLFENVEGDLYARRGTLKDVNIRPNWEGMGNNITYWIGFTYDSVGFEHNGIFYPYLGHTNALPTGAYYDFPFYHGPIAAISDNPWGSRDYDEDVDTYIFVR